jgi:hypothetical protein
MRGREGDRGDHQSCSHSERNLCIVTMTDGNVQNIVLQTHSPSPAGSPASHATLIGKVGRNHTGLARLDLGYPLQEFAIR